MKMKFFLAASALALAGMAPAAAQTAASGTVTADSATAQAATDPMQQIPHTLKALEEATSGKYGKLRADDSRLLAKADREISLLVQRHDDLHQLDAQEKIRLFNAQETIMAIVSGLRRGQLVCSYDREIGTRFKTRRCQSRELSENATRGARNHTERMQNPLCGAGCGD
jgi:hypothetical protein